MIIKLNNKHLLDLHNFILSCEDKFEDCYITKDKRRYFLNVISILKKVLNVQDIYGLYDKELKGILIVLREKGFRTYIKLLARDINIYDKLLSFFDWISFNEVYAKLKLNNPLVNNLVNKGFIKQAPRGREILLYKPKVKKDIRIIEQIKTRKINYIKYVGDKEKWIQF